MSSPVLLALAALAALVSMLVLGLRALAAAGARMQHDNHDTEPQPNPTPLLTPDDADTTDVWTTDLELWLRDHTTLNHIEDTLRAGLDNTLTRFVAALRLDEADLLEHPGFPGVRELVGVA